MRQVEPGGERRVQHRLGRGHAEGAAVRLDTYGVFVAAQMARL